MSTKAKKAARVLVADDDSSIRQLISTIVRREGLEVDTAVDGTEAIERLQQQEYAIILLDLMMPRTDGFGVISYLKANPQSRKPVILVITAYADQRFKEVDASIVAGVLRKPFDVADVGQIIQLCVRGLDEALQQHLSQARTRALREFDKGGTEQNTEH